MNYRHAFHAGNFADVLKHAVLARILLHLCDKPQAFRIIDTHAGTGLYDLTGAEASRTGEWRDGIGRITAAALTPAAQVLLKPYLAAVAAHNPEGTLRRYPGSPLVALSLMRPQDRLIACELEPGAAAALRHNLRADKRAKSIAIDGFLALNAYVPPTERRGVVVIDPPFEERDEFARLARGLEEAHRKWSTGIYLVWYPRKDPESAGAFAAGLKRHGLPKVLRVEIDLGGDPARLVGAGLLIVNPPWRLEEELGVLLPELAEVLGKDGRPRVRLDRLTSER